MTEFERKKHSMCHNEALVLVNLTHYFGMDTLCPQISQELAIILKLALSDFYVYLDIRIPLNRRNTAEIPHTKIYLYINYNIVRLRRTVIDSPQRHRHRHRHHQRLTSPRAAP